MAVVEAGVGGPIGVFDVCDAGEVSSYLRMMYREDERKGLMRI